MLWHVQSLYTHCSRHSCRAFCSAPETQTGNVLWQGIYDKRQRTEVEMAKRDQELKQLQGWRSTVQSLLERFQELTSASAAVTAAAAEAGAATPGQ